MECKQKQKVEMCLFFSGSSNSFHAQQLVFGVTRRSRSDAGHFTDSLMVNIDLTDVTLVSDDT